jgi:hypothetical protein
MSGPADPFSPCPTCPTCGYKNRITNAIEIAVKYGGTDGAHHKDWVIDQMVRALATDPDDPDCTNYEDIVREAKAGEDGTDTYEWSVGIAP